MILSIKKTVGEFRDDLNNNYFFKNMIKSVIRNVHSPVIRLFEIGTAAGNQSTKAIYAKLSKSGRQFELIGFEPSLDLYAKAVETWKNAPNVKILHNYFFTDEGLRFNQKVIQEILRSSPEVLNERYQQLENAKRSDRLITDIRFDRPDIIVIDSIRYSHIGIIHSIFQLGMSNALIVMEDDIQSLGELEIIKKYYKITTLTIHRCFPHQWPFAVFRFEGRAKSETI